MGKILKYELKRLLVSKFFIGLLVVNGLFAWYVLTSDTIVGTAYTAPFSPWSFGAYLASVMPVSMLAVLFLLAFYHSGAEKQVEALTAATPVGAVGYALIRIAAVSLGFAALVFMTVGSGACFYAVFFDYWHFAAFLPPLAATVLPCFFFVLGAGRLAGRTHPGLIYALMLVSLAAGFVKSPGAFDFYGGGYYMSTPMALPPGVGGEPAFVLSAAFLAGRAGYLAIGAALLAASIRRTGRKAG